jgi:Bacterial Ig domain
MKRTQLISSLFLKKGRGRSGRLARVLALGLAVAGISASTELASAQWSPVPGANFAPSPLGFSFTKSSRVKGWEEAWDPTGDTGSYATSYVNPSAFTYKFNGCRTQDDAKLSAVGAPTVHKYEWTYSGKTVISDSCVVDLAFPKQGAHKVGLKVTRPGGSTLGSWTRQVLVKDLLVVIIGDSMSSGEGAPNLETPAWVDYLCHRSANSGGVKAAERIEQKSLATVTLLNFACSGARINTDWKSYWGILDPYELDNPSSGTGIVGGYVGMVEDVTAATRMQKSQLQQIKDAVGDREIDAIIMSAGLNDMGMAKMTQVCVLFIDCFNEDVGYYPNDKPLKDQVKGDANKLPAHFKAMKAEMTRLGIKSKRKLLLEYPNPLTNNNGKLCDAILEDAVANNLFGGALHDLDFLPFKGWSTAEVKWANNGPWVWLNKGLRQGASIAGWEIVEGVSDAFKGHGYCSTNRFINTAQDAHKIHNGKIMTSAMHPNKAGYNAMADKIMVNLAGNNIPTLKPDTYTAVSGKPLSVSTNSGVLANDDDPDIADILRATLGSSVKHGTLDLNEDGSFTYTSNPGFVGTDSFLYIVPYTVESGSSTRLAKATIKVKGAPLGAIPAISGTVPPLLATLGEDVRPRAQAANGASVSEYFSDTFGDPLDYNNAEDVALVTEGPIEGVATEPTISGGQLHLEFTKQGYFSPAWAGYDAGGNERGSVAIPHDREVGNHPIDPAKYNKVRVRMNVSTAVGAGINFYTCPHGVNSTCETLNPFVATVGWKTYEFDLPKGAPVTGIRVAISPDAANPLVHTDVDWVQVVGAEQGNATTDGSVAGPLPEVLNPDIAGSVPYLFPAGGKAVTYSGRTCRNNDWATRVIDDSWDFSTPSDIALIEQYKPGWTANGMFAGQWDSVKYAGSSNPGDANLRLNMGKNVIDTNTFHRVTALLGKYEGKYSQQFTPNSDSGWVFRVMSKEKHNSQFFQQFKPVTQYPNDTTLSIDLKDPAPYDGVAASPTDSTEKVPGQFGWTKTQSVFRVDLYEPYNERFSYVDEVLLSTDDCGVNDFDIEFAENNNVGGNAQLMYSPSPLGPWKAIANVPAKAGRNTYNWKAPAGLWWVKVGITGSNGSYGENVSTGPVRIGTDFSTQIAANQKLKKG